MIRTVPNLELYKYSISNVMLYADNFDEPIKVQPLQVTSLTISKNYDKSIVPLMFMTLHVKKDEYEKITTSMKTLTAEFSVYKTRTSEHDNESIPYNDPCITGKFKAYNKDLLDTRVPSQMQDTTTDTTNNTQLTVEVNLYLYDHQKVLNYRKDKSYIATGTTNDVLLLALKDRGFNNIVLSPSNPNSSREFVIPYGSLGENYDFMNEYYGVYDNPRLFFADFDATYLLDKGRSGQDLRQNELASTFMYLEKTQDPASIHSGCYIDTANGQYILNASPFSVNDSDSMIDFNSAGSLRTMLIGGAGEYQNTVGDYAVEDAYLINNSKMHTQILFDIKDTKRTMNIEFSDIDIGIISPNKKYTLIPDSSYDSNYSVKGDYRLNQSSIVLTRRTEDTMRCVVQCGFSKL